MCHRREVTTALLQFRSYIKGAVSSCLNRSVISDRTSLMSRISMLLLTDVDKLTYRQLQLELKSRHLKAAGRTEVLRGRLRQSLIENNEDDSNCDDLEECFICLDQLSFDQRTTVTTTCSHRYHRICLKRWIESNDEASMCCPFCQCSLANDRHFHEVRDDKGSV